MYRITGRRFQVRTTNEAHEIGIACLRGSKEHEWRQSQRFASVGAAAFLRLVMKGDIKLTADNGLQTCLRSFLGKFKSPKKIIRVGNRNRRRLVGNGEINDFRNLQGAFK